MPNGEYKKNYKTKNDAIAVLETGAEPVGVI